MFVDSHCHLSFSVFEKERDSLINDFLEHKISFIINPGTTIEESYKALKCAEKYDKVYATVGIHPCEAKDITSIDESLVSLETLCQKNKVLGIGEIGLDLHYQTNPSLKTQEAFFREQIRLAKKLNLPIAIHSRDAWEDTFRILDEEKDNNLRGVFHCFSGGIEQAQKALSYGFKLSIAGTLTFKNSHLAPVVSQFPIETLLTETDAPYLSPVPHRGKQNNPLNVAYVTKEIARIKNLDVKEAAEKILQNTVEIFSIK